MRYSWIFVAGLAPVVVSAQNARVEDDGIPRVVASATKSARVVPDRAIFYAIVEGGAESASEATQRVERKLQTVMQAAKQLGAHVDMASAIPYGVMQAQNFGGYPGQPSTSPLVARYVLRIQPTRLDQLMNATSVLIGAGASAVTPPQFEMIATDSVRRAKFTEALAQARADAEALAAALGMRLGSLIEVSTTQGGPQNNYPQYVNFSRGFDMTGPGSPPEVSVSATVTVRYRLLGR